MLKGMNFKNDSCDETSQSMTEALRLLDMHVTGAYNHNKLKSDDPDYTPVLVIYLGQLEYMSLMELQRNNPGMVGSDTYRGFDVVHVVAESHLRVFCLNVPVVKSWA